jgi:hypothetical protein
MWGKPIPPGLKHGTHSHARYIYGCDCATCIPPGLHRGGPRIIEERPLTRRERSRRSRQNLYGKPVPAHVKHGIYAYNVYGCTCDICRKAKRAQLERKRDAWRAAARGHWVDLPSGLTVLHWPPADAPPMWTCPHCKELIFR